MKKATVFVAIALAVLRPFLTLSAHERGYWGGQTKSARTKGPIPIGFKTYSLFLVCNPMWLTSEKSKGLYNLYQQFQAFGRAIGDDHLAVWFMKRESSSGLHERLPLSKGDDQGLADHVDVERSVRFCQEWKLKPSEGPHVVVSSTYPDESHLSSGLPKDSAVFELGDMGPKQISDLLARLTDGLILKGGVDNAAGAPKPEEALWVRLLVAVQRSINSFGCAWSFKIEAGGVSANLHSCQSQ